MWKIITKLLIYCSAFVSSYTSSLQPDSLKLRSSSHGFSSITNQENMTNSVKVTNGIARTSIMELHSNSSAVITFPTPAHTMLKIFSRVCKCAMKTTRGKGTAPTKNNLAKRTTQSLQRGIANNVTEYTVMHSSQNSFRRMLKTLSLSTTKSTPTTELLKNTSTEGNLSLAIRKY